MSSEDSSDTGSITGEDDTRAGTSEVEEDVLPDGATYPLNSKKIVVNQLRTLAAMLELPSEGTAATLRQVIEGKLLELGHEPRNTQIIVASADSKLYLVDESGIIRQESEHVSVENASTHNINNAHVTSEIETLREELREARLDIESLRNNVHERDETLGGLHVVLETAKTGLRESLSEVEMLRREVKVQTAKLKRFWAQKCKQLLAHEAVIEEKDAEIARLQEQISTSIHSTTGGDATSEDAHSLPEAGTLPLGRRGKAPPVDSFKGSDPEVRFEDWLPMLERAANWNGWSEEEKLMQLAGHLRGKAAREYSLLSSEEKQSFSIAVETLQARLDPGSCALAAHRIQECTTT